MTVKKTREEVEALAAWMLGGMKKRSDVVGADLVYFFSESNSLSLRDGEPEENNYGVSGGIGIRAIGPNGRQGVAYGNNFSRNALENMMDWSITNAVNAEPEEGVGLYSGRIEPDDGQLEQFDPAIQEGVAQETRMNHCLQMTEIARSRDARVVSVRSASWADGLGESFYASSTGLSGWKQSTSVSCGASVVLNDGDAYELGGYGKAQRNLSDLDALSYARLAVDKTTRILGGKPLSTGKYTLIFEPEISASLIDEIGELFCASDIHKGRSMMKGKLGSSVSGACVTLVDDARLPRRMGSSLFDGEGVPTGKTKLIDMGIAQNYLYNMQYAAKDGVASTGNASRSLAGLPDVGTSNLVLLPGRDSQETLIGNTTKGFLVLELMGLHTLDPVSGDFSLGAKGIEIYNGILGAPVAGVTIAGNLFDLMNRIVAVGSDLEFFGSTGAPTIVVEDVAVAGN